MRSPRPQAWAPAALAARGAALQSLLTETEALWAPKPFEDLSPPWAETHPALMAFLDGLGDEALTHFEAAPDDLRLALAPWVPALAEAAPLLVLPGSTAAPSGVAVSHVSARKRAQIEAFINALPRPEAETGIDWCGGKGHLSRALHQRFGLRLCVVDKDQALLTAGQALAKGLPLRFENRDVLRGPSAPLEAHSLFALHACGGLHDAALTAVIAQNLPSLALAPCCYGLHRGATGHWESWAATTTPSAAFDASALRLAVADLATAPAGVRARRTRELELRQAFDAFQRATWGRNAYLPCPSFPASVIDGGFEAFAQAAARHHGLALPSPIDAGRWLALGRSRAALARRRSLLRLAFGRLIELRIIFDRALWLGEQGRNVAVSTFCDRSLSPRNVMIKAWR